MKYKAVELKSKGGWAVKRIGSHGSNWLSFSHEYDGLYWYGTTRWVKIYPSKGAALSQIASLGIL